MPLKDSNVVVRFALSRGLEFGSQIITPAMQAGLTKQRLTFRDIFTSIATFLRLARSVRVFILQRKVSGTDNSAISIAA